MKETKELLQKAITRLDSYIASFSNATNPQIVTEVIKARAERDAFQAVLDSLNKNKIALKIYAGEV